MKFINHLMSPRFSADYKIKYCHLQFDAQTGLTDHEIHNIFTRFQNLVIFLASVFQPLRTVLSHIV